MSNIDSTPTSFSYWKVFSRCLLMVAKVAPVQFILASGFMVAMGFVGGFIAPANELFFNAVQQAMTSSGAATTAYKMLGLLFAVMVLNKFLGLSKNFVLDLLKNRTKIKMDMLKFKKFGTLRAQDFEDPEFLISLKRSSWAIVLVFVDNWLNIIFFNGFTFLVLGIYLWSLSPILLLAFALTFVPTFLSNFVFSRITFKLQHTIDPLQMQAGTIHAHTVDYKDTRMHGAFEYFYKILGQLNQQIFGHQRQYQKQKEFIELGLSVTKALGWLGILALLFWLVSNGTISIGAFAAVFMATSMMFDSFEDMFHNIKSGSLFVVDAHNFLHFMDLPEGTLGSEAEPNLRTNGIVAANISFTYPAATKPAIDNVSITINPGETIAIVGENGSGKSTLTNLLCGLYKPDSGTVTLGGQCTKSTSDTALFSKTSAVFQNYMAYAGITLGGNINIGQHTSKDSVQDAANVAGVYTKDKATFLNGIDTMMGREYGGAELSGGQWQRVAIARGLYRKHQLIILDEPTSAIDPLEEARMYSEFMKYVEGKTAIIITHRLGAVCLADRIIVMNGGKIETSGTHQQLLTQSTLYKQMWATQKA